MAVWYDIYKNKDGYLAITELRCSGFSLCFLFWQRTAGFAGTPMPAAEHGGK